MLARYGVYLLGIFALLWRYLRYFDDAKYGLEQLMFFIHEVPAFARLLTMLILRSQSTSVSSLHFSRNSRRLSSSMPEVGTGWLLAIRLVASLNVEVIT